MYTFKTFMDVKKGVSKDRTNPLLLYLIVKKNNFFQFHKFIISWVSFNHLNIFISAH